jgi:DnaK suppressor protein
MLKKEIERFKRKLMAERRAVLESVNRTTDEILADVDDTTQDPGDLASVSHDRSVLYSLRESAAVRLKAIDEMLSRLESDHYGECERCGSPIETARLNAIPWATRCRPCQEIADMNEVLSDRQHDDSRHVA